MKIHGKSILLTFMSLLLILTISSTFVSCNTIPTKEETVSSDVTKYEVSKKETSSISSDTTISENNTMIPDLSIPKEKIPSTEAFTFVNGMKSGWNLGNTFDAFDQTVSTEDDLKYESMWCGSITTKKMIDEIKKAGFETIRIPVSWHNHVSGDDFQISEVWLNRVQEVVDYAIANDMYVIINIHHDNQIEYIYPSSNYMESSTTYVNSIWSQVGTRFKDYNDHLVFEGMNEPRLVGTPNEWWLDVSKEECKDAVHCINQLNQSFVDTIRSQGGNNATRYLMVPGYGASPDGVLTDLFVLPTDLATNKLIVSVHAYTPYSFALQPEIEAESTSAFSADNKNDTKDIQSFMDQLYKKFIANEIPVVIGEFGARDKSGNLLARVNYATYYSAYGKAMGIPCCWWDNNSYQGTGENFGIFDRNSFTIKYPEIVEGLHKYTE